MAVPPRYHTVFAATAAVGDLLFVVYCRRRPTSQALTLIGAIHVGYLISPNRTVA